MTKAIRFIESIKETVVGTYKSIESGVVNGYQKMENFVVSGFLSVCKRCERLFSIEQ